MFIELGDYEALTLMGIEPMLSMVSDADVFVRENQEDI